MCRGVYPEYLYYWNNVTFVIFKVTFTFQKIQFSATAGGNNSVGIRQVVKTKYCGCGSRRSRVIPARPFSSLKTVFGREVFYL